MYVLLESGNAHQELDSAAALYRRFMKLRMKQCLNMSRKFNNEIKPCLGILLILLM
jgi:hypothetical protein